MQKNKRAGQNYQMGITYILSTSFIIKASLRPPPGRKSYTFVISCKSRDLDFKMITFKTKIFNAAPQSHMRAKFVLYIQLEKPFNFSSVHCIGFHRRNFNRSSFNVKYISAQVWKTATFLTVSKDFHSLYKKIQRCAYEKST